MGYKSDLSKVNRTKEITKFPSVILLDNCSACNLRCSICDHKNIRKHRKIENMSIELYKKLINEIAKENSMARVWNIFFGDPFLCRDMAYRIEYAKNKGLQDVVLNSNGVLMKPDRAEELIRSGLDAMYVGIDAASEKTYNKIRTGGDFNKSVRNVLAYKDLLRKFGNGKQKLFVQFVVTEKNENELDDFKTFWKNNGVNAKIRPKISWAGLVQAKNLRDNKKIKRKSCYWLMQTMSICADGRVALCAVDLHCKTECGSALNNNILELWNGLLKKYRIIQKEEKWNQLPVMCFNCQDWQSGYADFVLSDESEED